MKTFACKLVGTLVITCWGEGPATDAEFQVSLDLVKQVERAHLRFLAITMGSGPTMLQRGRINALFTGLAVPVAVVHEIDSLIVQNLITATSWFSEGVKAFPASELRDALRYLGITAVEFPDVRREIELLLEIVRPPPPGTPKRPQR